MSSASAMAGVSEFHKVFVYGSLLADDVVRVLLNRIPQSSTAILNGFHRFSIRGCVYPAILPVPKQQVIGKVFPINSSFYTFEDVEYRRTMVEVSLMDNTEKLQAYAYVWCDKDDPNLFGEWDFEEWKRTHMNDFLKMTTGFMEELELPESKPRVATYESFFQPDGNPSSTP
ncbi:AIG2-like protein D isoform X2 [Jatropha curcas]|uniref:AIG2-like protein D isoform X2 n=1 Tax=Jatropha curcas TaxID=180498 RepID=UPI0005FBFD42|nr:AIG2-like protein D isoform X2 [Jatropha curcas]